ncbi:MAG: hypothetical protein QME40_05765 [bacterium]|nr:hypothetical protein [bacterium]
MDVKSRQNCLLQIACSLLPIVYPKSYLNPHFIIPFLIHNLEHPSFDSLMEIRIINKAIGYKQIQKGVGVNERI